MAAPAFLMLFRRRGDAMKTENFRYGSIVLLALGAACLGQAQSVSFSQVNWADGSGGYLAGGLNGDWAHARINFATSAGFTAGPGDSIRLGSTWSRRCPCTIRTSGRS